MHALGVCLLVSVLSLASVHVCACRRVRAYALVHTHVYVSLHVHSHVCRRVQPLHVCVLAHTRSVCVCTRHLYTCMSVHVYNVAAESQQQIQHTSVVSTTCGLLLVLLAVCVLLTCSLEGALWDTAQVRASSSLTAVCAVSSRMTGAHCMDHAVRGQVMLHCCAATSHRSAMLLCE